MELTKMKQAVCETIDKHVDAIIQFAMTAANNPELGFKEHKTAAMTAGFLRDLGYTCREGLAITGVRAVLETSAPGPNVAVLGELDAVICPDSSLADPLTGAAHTCGHHLQLAALVGTALGLKLSNAAAQLVGSVTFMAVPAEEYVEIAYRQKLRKTGKIHFLGGKQELIYRGEFDDIDMAMMIHSQKQSPEALVALGDSSNGFIGKTIQYIGREAHAAEAPHEGANALNAAMLGLMGIHALRETFCDQDIVRVHPIITKGGDLVNTVPADVRLETFVRAKTMAAIEATHHKVDRALLAGGSAIGVETVIHTIPGYLPLQCSRDMNALFKANAAHFLPADKIIDAGHFSASTDMGDVSHLLPSLHPFIGGVSGALHTRDFQVMDYNAAVILPAKLLAMTVIDLLANQAQAGKQIIANFTPQLTKQQYIAMLEKYFS